MSNNEKQMLCLGKRIRQARMAAGLTQEELAERMKVSRTALARYESGDIEPRIRNLIALTEQLNVSADYLLGTEKKKDVLECVLSVEARTALMDFISEIRKDKKLEKRRE